MPLLSKPFSGEFVLGNFFDHDVPYEFIDNNGFQLTTWGARTVAGVDGHNGYDWYMPDGTPLLAAGDGVVARAGASSPFFCPFLGRTVSDSLGVDIIHITSDGPRFRTSASHMSRVDVSVGQIISSGDQIGLSGHSGCTTVSHAHFTVQRLAPGAAHGVVVDPYGRESPQPDPWELRPDGAMSLWLWRDREAPAIYREQVASIQTSGNPRVRISRLRWMGWHDDVFPNNQFVELAVAGEPAATIDLSGLHLENNAGDVFRFPPGTSLRSGNPVVALAGEGQDIDSELYWGPGRSAFNPTGDCIRLVSADGRIVDAMGYLGADCS